MITFINIPRKESIISKTKHNKINKYEKARTNYEKARTNYEKARTNYQNSHNHLKVYKRLGEQPDPRMRLRSAIKLMEVCYDVQPPLEVC